MAAIFPMILLFLVLFVIFMVFLGVRNKEDLKKGGEDVIKSVYIYLVLFATLMMTIGGTVAAFMAIADVVAPTPYYQTFEEFKLNNGDMKPEIDRNAPGAIKLSDTELRAKYEAMVSGEKNRQIERAKNSLIKSLGWIVIPLPVFLYFQRRLVTKEA